MALKQDYILRMVEELINVLIKTLKDGTEDKEEINSFDANNDELYLYLKKLVDDKKINEAENYLFEKLNENNKKDFLSGMAFYKYLNENGYLRWTANDQISIFEANTYNQQYKFTGETGANSGTFEKVTVSYPTGTDLNQNDIDALTST